MSATGQQPHLGRDVSWDTAIGAVPVVGEAFDVMFRANIKNMALLRRHLEKKRYGRVGGRVVDDVARAA